MSDLARLLDTIAYGEEHGMTLYGGGQFELGVGRSHIQTFAIIYKGVQLGDAPVNVIPAMFTNVVESGIPHVPKR